MRVEAPILPQRYPSPYRRATLPQGYAIQGICNLNDKSNFLFWSLHFRLLLAKHGMLRIPLVKQGMLRIPLAKQGMLRIPL